MANAVKIKKLHGSSAVGEEQKIAVTHLTIRQSIFFMIMKLLVLEVFAAFGIVCLHLYFYSTKLPDEVIKSFIVFGMPVFIILVIIKTVFMSNIIIQWLEEYYEITPTEVVHKRVLIFKKEDRYSLEHIRSIGLSQGILGRIFNYGNLTLHDWLKDKYIYLYLIHSPKKYYQVLLSLLPEADTDKQVFREHIIEPE